MSVGFQQRCQLALTHPVTLVALGTLLLNDLVFKSLWSNPWTTGKLSDLAWVVFASPLLAWLLSLVVRKRCGAQRAAWLTAYVGLPLLYAAFNTFASVHHAILRGISFVSGGTAGSPLDPTDSLVIPLGLSIALLVWRRGEGRAGLGRQHIAMASAGLAVVASIATSYPEPAHGVLGFALTGENTVVASGGWKTSDGGLTWAVPSTYKQLEYSQRQSVETPRGRFAIVGTAIIHTGKSGVGEEVYSAAYLSGGASEWVQIQNTYHRLNTQPVTRSPQAVIYDPQSGNVIVAMGLQGVVVGTPDGEWTPVAVGSNDPVVFSVRERTLTLLSARKFWYSVILVPLSGVAVVAVLTLIWGRTISESAPLEGRVFPIISIVFSVPALVLALFILLTFQNFRDGVDLLHDVGIFAFAFVDFVLAVLALLLCIRPIELWKSMGIELISWRHLALTFSAMLAFTALPFIIWIQFNLSPSFVHASAVILVIIIGSTMIGYSISRLRSASSPPPDFDA